MEINENEWLAFIDRLSALSKKASDKMLEYIQKGGGFEQMDVAELIGYATALVQKYGEGAATLTAMMYDAIAELSGLTLPAAEVAEVAGYGDLAKAIQGAAKFTLNEEYLAAIVGRYVKRAGADTTLHNAIRDKAEFAWIPHGDTCAFCIALAGRGWQEASESALKDGHAEHIHSNCDCMYAVRFSPDTKYRGYDPGRYRKMYDRADGDTSEEKINAMRRAYYAENKEKINEQKRSAYEKSRERESSAAEELDV